MSELLYELIHVMLEVQLAKVESLYSYAELGHMYMF
jgi:hypothetical protein